MIPPWLRLVCAPILMGAAAYAALLNWQQYRRFPSVPQKLALRDARQHAGAWVEVIDPVFRCDHVFERELPISASQAKAHVFYILVTDRTQDSAVLAEYGTKIDCDAVRSAPLRGVFLPMEGTAALQELRSKGLWLPPRAARQPVLQLDTGLGPRNSLVNTSVFGFLALLGMAWTLRELRQRGEVATELATVAQRSDEADEAPERARLTRTSQRIQVMGGPNVESERETNLRYPAKSDLRIDEAGMGRLLFVQTGRFFAITWFVVGGLCGSGGLWFLLEGESVPGLSYWSFNLPLGLFLLGAAVLFCGLGTKQLGRRTELYEQGFIHTARDRRLIVKYSELRSLAYEATDSTQSYTRLTVLALQTNRGEIVRVVNQVAFGTEDVAMEAVRSAASFDLAQRWRERLEAKRPIDWLVDRKGRPLVQIMSTGVQARARADDAFEYTALVDLEYELWEGRFSLKKAGRKLVTVDAASPNFYPGLTLLEQLDEEQQV